MELTQIKYFIAAAQLQNLSKAAERLGISQPSLSKSILRLEQELGCALFSRTGKKVELNEQGQRFLSGALAVVRELEATSEAVGALTRGRVETLRVGAYESEPALLDCMRAFAGTHEELAFELDGALEAVEQPDINAYDVLLYPECEAYKKFKGIALKQERWLLAVSPGHRLSEAAGVTPEALCAEPLVILRYGGKRPEQAYDLCLGLGLRPHVRCFTNTRQAHLQIINEGLASGFVPEGLAESYLRCGLRLLPVEDEAFSRTLMLCFKREKHLTPAGLAFKRFVLSAFGLEEGERMDK